LAALTSSRAIIIARMSAATSQPPGATISPEPPRQPWWLAKRVLAAAVGITLLSGAATAVFALSEVDKVVEALRASKPVTLKPNTLAPTSQGAPETLLLVGNDERPPPKNNPSGAVEPHSNEMLLVRIDPSKPTISMLSIPRELQVTFTAPNGQLITNRINSAYTYGYEEAGGTTGGVQLMLETVKRVLGVAVNHVFVANFPKFKRAVNEIGCVYMMVDRRYHHVNEPGGEQYFEINLQPGYQRLCGTQALEFVANRHQDTSLIRDARDQRFLLSVKGQYGPSALENREKLERIFGKTVETDTSLHDSEKVLQLLELLAESAGKPVRRVPFHVNLLPTYDTASKQQIKEAVYSFMHGTSAISTHAPSPQHLPAPRSHSRSARHSAHGAPSAATLGMTLTPSSTLEEARAIAAHLSFPMLAPRYQITSAAAPPDLLHRYYLLGPARRFYPAYVISIDRGGLGEYYDVEGTSWTGASLLSKPMASVKVGSRTYDLFYDGEHIKTVSWRESGAVYWIENSLTNGLSPTDMVAVAQETLPVTNRVGHAAAGPGAPVGGLALPPGRPTISASLIKKVGAGVGILVLMALIALSVLLVRRQRELIALREQVRVAMALEARRHQLLAAGRLPELRSRP
jgi:polyisoprenyl-teichoic acid--peptidoglycan teichoic acid transferase